MAKTEVELPEGVDLSGVDLQKLFGTFLKSRISGAARDKAVREATKKLITAHKAQYETFLAAEMPKGA